MPADRSCPPKQLLERFARGELSDPEAEQVGRHIVGCSSCAERLNALHGDDPFVAQVQAACVRQQPTSPFVQGLMEQLLRARPVGAGAEGTELGAPPPAQGGRPQVPPIDSVTGLVDTLSQSRLLGPAQRNELSVLQGRFREPRGLARELLQRNWLTAYQVNQVFLGRSHDLVLGDYLLLERLGEGGFGQVFKARHQLMNRVVAVKVIRKDRLGNVDAVRRFQREIRAVAQLSHPNIITAHDAALVGDTYLLVMEYVEGVDLKKLVEKRGPLPVAEACSYMWQAALGLQHALESGLVHRDIKPANLLLAARSAVVKILDMGLARLHEVRDNDQTAGDLTQEGSVMGTPDYMAPEQSLGSHTVDIRADLYSLGCSLFYLLTGKPPFAGGTLGQKIARHQLEPPPAVEKQRPDVPASLGAVLSKLMAKRPEERYQTPSAAAAALEPFCAAVSQAAGGNAAAPAFPLAVPVGVGLAAPAQAVARSGDETVPLALGESIAASPLPLSPHAKRSGRLWGKLPTCPRAVAIGSGLVLLGIVVCLAIKLGRGVDSPSESTNEKAKAKPALVGDPHRRLAAMVLDHEGTLTVRTAKEHINVARMKDLPKEPFLVVYIKRGTKPIPDQALEAFEGVHEVPTISLTVAGTAGVGHLRDVAAQEIVLDGEKLNGDECLKLLGERPDLLQLTIRCSSLSDAAVPLLLRMKRLRGLALTGCSKLTNAGIKALASHPALAFVHIDPITPEAAALFNQLPFLRQVNLSRVDDAAVPSLSGLTRAAAVQPGANLSDDAARSLQKALPNAVIFHGAIPPTEAERSAFQWALDRKAFVSVNTNWSESIKEVPTSVISLGQLSIPDDVVKTGASHLRGIRCVHSLQWFGLKNADEEAEHIATLDSLLSLWLGRTTLTAKGMERLTALKRLEALSFMHIPTITTEALSYIPKFEQLSSIGMNGCPITESGLAELAKAKGLQDLTVEWCTGPFTGAGLKHLASLPLLRHLTLRGTPLDASSVGSLKLLTSLRVLDVRQTQRVADDIVELHKALPKCAIVWDGGLIVPGMEGEREAKQP